MLCLIFKQLCSALEPEMEILWSGTPGAAKKVSIRNLNLQMFCFCIVWYVVFIYKVLSYIREMQDYDSRYLLCVFLLDGFYRQVKQISGAHNKAETNPPTKIKKRRISTRGMAPSVVSFFNTSLALFNESIVMQQEGWSLRTSSLLQDTQQSVTVVLFRDQHTLISSGAVDG